MRRRDLVEAVGAIALAWPRGGQAIPSAILARADEVIE
jgi:hypothetical protein